MATEFGGWHTWTVETRERKTKYRVPSADGLSAETWTRGWIGLGELYPFRDNIAYGCREGGVYTDHTLANHRIENLTCHSCWGGDGAAAAAVFTYNATSTTIIGGTFIGARVDAHTNPLTAVYGCTIVGNDIGIAGWAHTGTLVVRECTLRNVLDIDILFSQTVGSGPIPRGGVAKITRILTTDCGKIRLRYLDDANYPPIVPILGNVVEIVDCPPLGLAGRHRAHYHEQAADAPCPHASDIRPRPGMLVVACPEKGLTNVQALAKHGVCVGGSVTPPSAVAIAGVEGGLVAPEGG